MLRRISPIRAALVTVSVLAVGALAAAIYFGIDYGKAYFVDKSTAQDREDALAGARQAAVNLSSYDTAKLDESFARIETSITGDAMRNDLDATKKQVTDQMRQSGAKIEGAVLSAALTELNRDEGKADALVVIASTTTRPNQAPSKQKVTFRMSLEDVDGDWKASKLENVGAPTPMDSGVAPPAQAGQGQAPAPAPAPAPEPAPAQGN